MYKIDFSILSSWIPHLLKGMLITIELSIITFIIGSILGIIIGSLKSSIKNKIINIIASIYVELFRGTPVLVQLFLIYFGLGQLGLLFTPIQAGIITFSLNTGAYVSEIIRGAILGIDKGQFEAASALGLSTFKCYIYIILPQAIRIAIPPLVNTISAILKDTSLISTIAVIDLTRVGQMIYTSTFRPFEAFIAIGCIYLFLNICIVYFSKFLEKKINFKYC